MKEEQQQMNLKKDYLPPKIGCIFIEMEQGIAAASVVQPGGGSGVDVDPWVDGGSAGDGELSSGEWWQ